MTISYKISKAVHDRLNNWERVWRRTIEILDPKLLAYCDAKAMDLGYKEPFAILYLILHQKSNECETCGNGTAFQNMKQGFKRFCSRRCRANSPEQIEMTRERLHNDKVRSKILATSKAKYGTPYAITSKQARAKSAKTCLKRYGVENGGAAPEARAKRAKTMIDRYGVEDVALQYLHHELKVPADKIITTHKEGIPTIPWTDNEGKDRRYHPDIYIYAKVRGRWWLIEVKSSYTAGLHSTKTGLYSVLRRKIKACVEAGYPTKVLIVDRHLKVFPIKNLHLKAKAEVRKELAEQRHGLRNSLGR